MGWRRVQGDEATAGNPASVPIWSIAHNPGSLRDGYDDTAELAQSIRQVGVLQALGVIRYDLFVIRYPEHEREVVPSDWVVITGNRRLTAARLAELEEVPVHVFDRLDRDQLDEVALIDNIHWAPLPPLREAQALQLLVQRHGSPRQVAERIGKSPGFVSQRLALLELPAELRDAVAARTLTVEEARRIWAMPARQQQAIVDAGPPYMVGTEPGERTAANSAGGQSTLVIQVPTHSPERLAAELRARLSTAELAELARRLGR